MALGARKAWLGLAAYPDLLDRLQLRLFRREADQDDRPEDAEGAPHGAASVQRLTQEAVGKDLCS